ncbi:hypothetical protein GCM10010530_53540 [Kribbella aluminosa]
MVQVELAFAMPGVNRCGPLPCSPVGGTVAVAVVPAKSPALVIEPAVTLQAAVGPVVAVGAAAAGPAVAADATATPPSRSAEAAAADARWSFIGIIHRFC